MSICSEHRERVDGCPRCRVEVTVKAEPMELTTCKHCNFVYYKNVVTCPKCQKENL